MFADAISNPSINRVSYPASDYGSQITTRDSAENAVPLYTLGGVADGSTVSVNKLVGVASVAFNGSAVTRQRTSEVVKTANTSTTSDVAVWTPVTGKRYRLLKYQIIVSANASLAVAGNLVVTLKDGATANGVSYTVPLLTSVGAGSPLLSTGQIDLGVGLLSGQTNRSLNVALSAALATGFVQVLAFGNEE